MNIKKCTTENIVFMGILLAVEIVIGKYLTISTIYLKIGFAFAPIALTAVLFGPVEAAVIASIADIIIALLNPFGYYPGFTVSAFLTGIIYGIAFYKKTPKMWRVVSAVIISKLAISVFLNSYWLYKLTGQAFLAVLLIRLIQNIIMIPIEILVIWFIIYPIAKLRNKMKEKNILVNNILLLNEYPADNLEYSCAATPQIRQTGNRLSGLAETAY
ncbi:folate family ECF transporter S component, partial [[Ruminococcus] gnavus]